MNPESRPSAAPGAAAVVIGTSASQVAVAMAIAVFPVIAPQLAARLGVDASLVGYQMSLLFASAMAVSPMVGTAVLRWGACRTMQIALGVCVLGMAMALAGNLYFLALASMLVGVSAALVAAGAAHLLFRFTPPQHINLLFSIKQTGVPIGWATIALLAPTITLVAGWRWSLAAVLFYGVTMIIVLQRARARWDDDRDPAARMQGHVLEGVRLLWRDPVMRRLGIASFFFSFVQLCLGTFTVTLLVQEAGYGLVEAGFMFALLQIAGISGRLLLGWIADVTGSSIRILRLTDLVVAACCIITAFINASWPPVLLALHYTVFGVMAYGWNGVLHAQIARLSPKGMVSTATGGIMVWIFAGTLFGPALFAAAYRHIGSYTAGFGALAAVALAGWVMLRSARGADRQQVSD